MARQPVRKPSISPRWPAVRPVLVGKWDQFQRPVQWASFCFCGQFGQPLCSKSVQRHDSQDHPTTTNWVVSTIAGTVGTSTGYRLPIKNGTNSQALFNSPTGIAVDAAGILYVADQQDNVIRRIAPIGTNWVTTSIAGSLNGVAGSANGANSVARFSLTDRHRRGCLDEHIRRRHRQQHHPQNYPLWRELGVSTIAGKAGITGVDDGTNAAAQFNLPSGVAVDSSGREIRR